MKRIDLIFIILKREKGDLLYHYLSLHILGMKSTIIVKCSCITNVHWNVFPIAKIPESNNEPVSLPSALPEVTVCIVESPFFQVTVVPFATVKVGGSKN